MTNLANMLSPVIITLCETRVSSGTMRVSAAGGRRPWDMSSGARSARQPIHPAQTSPITSRCSVAPHGIARVMSPA